MTMKNLLLPVTTKVHKSMVKHFTSTAKGAEALAYGPQQEYIYKYKIYGVERYHVFILCLLNLCGDLACVYPLGNLCGKLACLSSK